MVRQYKLCELILFHFARLVKARGATSFVTNVRMNPNFDSVTQSMINFNRWSSCNTGQIPVLVGLLLKLWHDFHKSKSTADYIVGLNEAACLNPTVLDHRAKSLPQLVNAYACAERYKQVLMLQSNVKPCCYTTTSTSFCFPSTMGTEHLTVKLVNTLRNFKVLYVVEVLVLFSL